MPVGSITRVDELKATDRLPSPTGVALAVLRLTQSNDTSAQEIAQVLQSDPALTGRLLKYANSAHVGAGRPVVAVLDAVVRLGLRTVRQLALGFSLFSDYRTGPCDGFDYHDFWSRSLARAIAIQSITHRGKAILPEEAFTCGLLAQIGRLALATVHPESYSTVLALCETGSEAELIRLERQQFAIDHNELSAAMLKDWGLPDVIVEAVHRQGERDHVNLPEDSRARALAWLIHVSSRMAALCVADPDESAVIASELLPLVEQIGVSSEEFQELFEGVVGEWREWGKILEVPTKEVPSIAEMAAYTRQRVLATEDPEPEVGKPQRDGLRILAVDDNPDDLRLLTNFLAAEGYQVTTAGNGREGLRAALDTDPQLIITDWMMPEMMGPDLCRALRKTKKGRQIYIIMLTGFEDEEQLVEALEAGADDFVVKPYNRKALMARIRAGQRIVSLQEEVDRDKERIRRCIGALGVANRRLEHAALTDELTDLPNRRYALDRLDQECSAAMRNGRSLACMIVDIDHFKDVNDTFGHHTGDQVLKETAAVLKSTMRRNDVVCRFGGEEFVVICPDTSVDDAAQLAERLRNAVEGNTILAPGFSHHVQVSIGVVARTHVEDPNALLKAADLALYAAKRSGRNRVCVDQSCTTLSPVPRS